MSASGDLGLRPSLSGAAHRVLHQEQELNPAGVAQALSQSGQLFGASGTLQAIDEITAELTGLGRLEAFARDESVTDILVNAPDAVWVDRGRGLERISVAFTSEREVRALAVRLINAAGSRLDDGCPSADVQLSGGVRVHAVLPPVSVGGTVLSLRFKRHRRMSLAALASAGMMAAKEVELLRRIVDSRLNLLISGATGSGKTTLLSALLSEVSSDQRLLLIEDVSELEPDHPHAVQLQARRSNVEGSGAIDLAELVRQALRMRPDRLIVGECRGSEVRELLAAMNTGHRGAGATVHANNCASIPARMVALGALAGLSAEATALQCVSALDVVIHLERGPRGRRVTEIGVLAPGPQGGMRVRPALRRGRSSLVPDEAFALLEAMMRPESAVDGGPATFDGPR